VACRSSAERACAYHDQVAVAHNYAQHCARVNHAAECRTVLGCRYARLALPRLSSMRCRARAFMHSPAVSTRRLSWAPSERIFRHISVCVSSAQYSLCQASRRCVNSDCYDARTAELCAVAWTVYLVSECAPCWAIHPTQWKAKGGLCWTAARTYHACGGHVNRLTAPHCQPAPSHWLCLLCDCALWSLQRGSLSQPRLHNGRSTFFPLSPVVARHRTLCTP